MGNSRQDPSVNSEKAEKGEQSSADESSDSNFTITFDDEKQEVNAAEEHAELYEEKDSPIANRTRAAKRSPRKRCRIIEDAAKRASGSN